MIYVMSQSKYEKTEYAGFTIVADDISLYPQKLAKGKITYGKGGIAERKNLPIKVRLIGTAGRPPQFALELQGEYHVEDMSYYQTNPDGWRSYGKIWLSLDDAENLADFIKQNIPKKELKNINILDVCKNNT